MTAAAPPPVVLAIVTVPPDDAAPIAHRLVEDRLAACASIVPTVSSIYRWQGIVQQAFESMLLIKTTRDQLGAVEALLREVHPYDTFELIAHEVVGGSADYLAWVAANVGPPTA